MTGLTYVSLTGRGLVRLSGDDTTGFLQALVTNDVERVTESRAVYAALLTAQGKYLHDFFMFRHQGALWLDCEGLRTDDLLRRLARYKLRAKVEMADAGGELSVFALLGEGACDALGLSDGTGAAAAFGGGIAYADPRIAAIGARAALPPGQAAEFLVAAGFKAGTAADYDRLRVSLGLPDGSRDMEVERTMPLENGFEEFNGVDFDKGCYVGQEVTVRIKTRGLVRKRLFPVAIEGEAPACGTPVMRGDAEAGRIRAVVDGAGLALLRLDHVEAAESGAGPLTAGGAVIRPLKPGWVNS
jgi:folate-binding protein YgfZ